MDINEKSMYYKRSEGVLYCPVSFKLEEIERLLLIGIEKEPDEIYVGFEAQYFNDGSHGKGLRLLAARKDGYVDVYQQPSLYESKSLDVAGKGLGDLAVREMTGFQFEIDENGASLEIEFVDKLERSIHIKIKEGTSKPTRPFNMLAPLGSSSVNPPSLPLFILYDFYFVRRHKTEAFIKISGKTHKPDSFPLPMDGSRIYFMRYSKSPFLVNWNENYKGPVPALHVDGSLVIDIDDTAYKLIDNEGNYEIKEISCSSKEHSLKVSFEPPIPELLCIRDKVNIKGSFVTEMEGSLGSIDGSYTIARSGDELTFCINPTGGWKPKADRLLLKLIFKKGSIFREWSKSYVWKCNIKQIASGSPAMEASWQRKV